MTPAELDALADVQADIRRRYQVARSNAHRWEPAPSPGPANPCGLPPQDELPGRVTS